LTRATKSSLATAPQDLKTERVGSKAVESSIQARLYASTVISKRCSAISPRTTSRMSLERKHDTRLNQLRLWTFERATGPEATSAEILAPVVSTGSMRSTPDCEAIIPPASIADRPGCRHQAGLFGRQEQGPKTDCDFDDPPEDDVLLIAAQIDLIPSVAVGRVDQLRAVSIGHLTFVGLLVVPVDQVEVQTLRPPIIPWRRGPVIPPAEEARQWRLLIRWSYSEDLEAARGADFFSIKLLDLVVGSEEIARTTLARFVL
jgi:hypothetical protein